MMWLSRAAVLVTTMWAIANATQDKGKCWWPNETLLHEAAEKLTLLFVAYRGSG